MAELENAKKETHQNWEQVKNATDDNWEKFKDTMDAAGDKLENGWNRFVADMRS
jgi:hypothetical protein